LDTLNDLILTGKIIDILPNTKKNIAVFKVANERLSGISDTLIVHAQHKLVSMLDLKLNDYIEIKGSVRTANARINEKTGSRNCVLVYVYAFDINRLTEEERSENTLNAYGTLCKMSEIRTTDSGRIIIDGILKTKRKPDESDHKYDYIPVVFWGNNAVLINKITTQNPITISGRFQSRQYYSTKREQFETAYEVSVNNVDFE
jgi:primosomal replication protein N